MRSFAFALITALAVAGCHRSEDNPTVTPRAAPAAPTLGADGPATLDADGSGQLTDAGITARVKTTLMGDEQVKGLPIKVETHDAAVTLAGALDTNDQVVRAVALARGVAGVREVVNRLSVKGEDSGARSNQG